MHDDEPGPALVGWLRDVIAYTAGTRGLSRLLLPAVQGVDPTQSDSHALLADAGGQLLARAQGAGAAHMDISIGELLALVSAISVATENAALEVSIRLMGIAINGIQPPQQR